MLPACPPGLRVLAAARSSYVLPSDVRDDHPLQRCRELEITSSPWAGVQQRAAEVELERLLHDDERRDLLAFLAVSGGGLSRDDLAILTSRAPYSITQALTGVTARTVICVSSGAETGLVFTFAHERLLAAARSAFGATALDQYGIRIDEWARNFQIAGWPAESPRYLLADYGAKRPGERPPASMISFALDSTRHERMLDLVNGHTSALREVDAAGQLLISKTPDDVETGIRLAIERNEVSNGHQVGLQVITTWAAVGNPRRAQALALSTGNTHQVGRALVALAVSLTRCARPDLAEQILGTTISADWANAALAKMAQAAAEERDVSTTARIAGRLTGTPHADRAFAALIRVTADAGEFDKAEDYLRRNVTSREERKRALASIAAAWARTGKPEAALARAKEESIVPVRDAALEAIARVVIAQGDLVTLQSILGHITDGQIADRCRAHSVGLVYSSSGRQAADGLIASLAQLSARDQASVNLALALARDGKTDDAESIVAEVSARVGEAPIALAVAVAATGDVTGSMRLATRIRKEDRRARCLAAIARRSAELGQFDRAEYLARQITNPERAASALAALARVSYRMDRQDRGFAAAAEEMYRSHARQRRASRAFRALAAALADVDDVRRASRALASISDPLNREIAAQSVARPL